MITGIASKGYSQDVIFHKNGSEIKAQVIEITETEVMYKKFTNPTGPTYNLKIDNIIRILYGNGDEDIFNEEEPPAQKPVARKTEVDNPTVRQQADETDAYNRRSSAAARRAALTREEQSAPSGSNPARSSYGSSNRRTDYDRQNRRIAEKPVEINSDYNTASLRRGYIGLSFGYSECFEDSEAGGSLLGINFGYLYHPHIGIAAMAYSATYDKYRGNAGLLVGPLISIGRAYGNFAFDFRPMIGFAGITPRNDYSGSFEFDENEIIAFDLGFSFRWSCGRHVSVLANIDFLGGPNDYGSANLSVGVNYRLP
jgi:hypothetical protein